MISIIDSIISNVLKALYQPFWFSLLAAILFMFVYKQNSGIKEAVKQWLNWFKIESDFRKMFLLAFYTMMILMRTLLNRSMWANPVMNVIGIWGFYSRNASTGQMALTTEMPENLLLFMPFSVLLLWRFHDKIFGEKISLKRAVWQSTKITFIFSFTIEMLQLFLRLGTWQLSDLFFNTVGGLFGGVIYYIGYKIKYGTNNK